MAQYQKPPAYVAKVINPVIVSAITRLGIRPGGMAVLEVRGRKSGKDIRIPLNPVEVNGKAYLMSPRGEMQWVKNVRAADGVAKLHLGRTSQQIVLKEETGEIRVDVLREYVRRFYSQIKGFVSVSKADSDEELRAVVDKFPMFLVEKA